MSLPAQKYSNIYREVNGTVTVYSTDVELKVNTSFEAATINLPPIPAGAWNTAWRLYVYDLSGNAGTYNITINAGSGQTVNGNQSSFVMSTNNQRAVIRISSDSSYIIQTDVVNSGTASVTSAQLASAVSALNSAINVVSVAAANALSVANSKNPILTVQGEGYPL